MAKRYVVKMWANDYRDKPPARPGIFAFKGKFWVNAESMEEALEIAESYAKDQMLFKAPCPISVKADPVG